MAPVLAPATVVDPSAAPIVCEVCGTATTVGASHSFVIVYATTGGTPGLGAFGCPSEQHFCCSQVCAARAAHACIDEHLLSEHAARLDALPPAPAQPPAPAPTASAQPARRSRASRSLSVPASA